jgi:hypothetical protein
MNNAMLVLGMTLRLNPTYSLARYRPTDVPQVIP